jgi:hypothetical protein
MIIRRISILIAVSTILQADPYSLGQGINVNKMLNVGGYFSTEYLAKKGQDTASVEDVAVMAYGDINPMFSYLAELESAGFYSKNISTGVETGDHKFHTERFYGDLWLADAYNIRFGKQITPIGYWNKEPINVLRDTTSNPLYTTLLFPRLLTGIDINGYIPGMEGAHYHLFGQKNHDFDDDYINIPNTHFFGLSVEKELSTEWSGGGSAGEYTTLLTNQRTRFMQANAKYDDDTWQVMGEALMAKSEYAVNQHASAFAGYLQGMYRYTPQHAFITRGEYFNDHHSNYKDTIGIVGYSYRPVYPVSFKGEYQWHSLNAENRFLLSFSVLF